MRRRKLFELIIAIIRDEKLADSSHWGSSNFWHALLPIADLHLVAQALPRRLQAHGLWDQLPKEVATLLSALHDLNLARNQELATQGLEVLATLQGAGIRAIPLKGFAYILIGLYADDPGQRLTGDIDILVSQEDAIPAQKILIDSGYTSHADDTFLADYTFDEKVHHHLPTLIPGPQSHGPSPVEIHFRLGRPEHSDLLPVKNIMFEAVNIEAAGRPILVPTYAALLDHAVIHTGFQNGLALLRSVRLRDTFDIGRLWKMARLEGIEVSDLRIAHHGAVAKYFGASLLLGGVSASELGILEKPARRCLAQLLMRQSIRERPALEYALMQNVNLLFANPVGFASPFQHAGRIRKAISLLSSRAT